MNTVPTSSEPRESTLPVRDGEPDEVTRLLRAWSRGEEDALQRLVPLVYGRLRSLASGLLWGESRHRELEPAALVNEAYLRLVTLDRIDWKDRAHFFALCARFMRRILIDQARFAAASKRSYVGPEEPVDDLDTLSMPLQPTQLIALEDALRGLADHDPEGARIIELRFFGGLVREEIAEAVGLSSASVTRRWRIARAWLFRAMSSSPGVASRCEGRGG